MEACYAFGHLYMNADAKLAVVEQQFGGFARRSFGVVGQVLAADEITPDMRFCRLAGGVMGAPEAEEEYPDPDACTLVLPAIFPDKLRSEGVTDVLILGPEDAVFASSGALLRALARMMRRYDALRRALGMPPYGISG